MEENSIFGSELQLPSLPGLESTCEEEIRMLMKEVDIAFQRKHKVLQVELKNARVLCHAQKNEIENLRSALVSNDEDSKYKKLQEQLRMYSKEIGKLKEENVQLKGENNGFKKRIRKGSENELQCESLKRSLGIQQDENKILKEKLQKLNQQHETLQVNYQKLLNVISFQQESSHEQKQMDSQSPANFIQTEIAQVTEKFFLEEAEHCSKLQSKINQEIDDLEKRLRAEII